MKRMVYASISILSFLFRWSGFIFFGALVPFLNTFDRRRFWICNLLDFFNHLLLLVCELWGWRLWLGPAQLADVDLFLCICNCNNIERIHQVKDAVGWNVFIGMFLIARLFLLKDFWWGLLVHSLLFGRRLLHEASIWFRPRTVGYGVVVCLVVRWCQRTAWASDPTELVQWFYDQFGVPIFQILFKIQIFWIWR